MSPRAVVVHDVLGTLFSLDAPIQELQSIFAAQLANAPHIFAELVVMDWYHAAQRDFGFISMHGAYKPIGQVFSSTLPRVLLQAGLAPEVSSSDLSAATRGAGRKPATAVEASGFEEVVQRMMGSLKRLTPRPHMQDAFATYEAAGIEAWGASNGSRELSTAIFEGALGKGCVRDHGVTGEAALKGVGVFSCDEVQIAKPDPRVYTAVLERIERGEKDIQKFFVATHSWDTFAAQKAGFKVVWVTNEEFHGAAGIYGTPDYIATDLADAAKQIAAAVRS